MISRREFQGERWLEKFHLNNFFVIEIENFINKFIVVFLSKLRLKRPLWLHKMLWTLKHIFIEDSMLTKQNLIFQRIPLELQ